MALLIGGSSRHYDFNEKDEISLVGVVESMILSGASAMITPSRRTPERVLARLRGVCADAPRHTFLWDGAGANPYVQMLAHASTIVVTADSTNMVGRSDCDRCARDGLRADGRQSASCPLHPRARGGRARAALERAAGKLALRAALTTRR